MEEMEAVLCSTSSAIPSSSNVNVFGSSYNFEHIISTCKYEDTTGPFSDQLHLSWCGI